MTIIFDVLFRDRFNFAVLAFGVIYTLLQLTPSSYGVALTLLGAPGEGLYAFNPHGLRADEWSVWTSYIQVAVNNDFERINTTSIYGEDLRNFNGLPLLDWALIFKPQFWLFFIAPASWAFSFYHAFWLVAFLTGWRQLLITYRLGGTIGIWATVLLLFSSGVWMWWTSSGPLMAGLPWILLAVQSRLPYWVRLPLICWLLVVWMLSHFYPPVLISLGFAGGIALLTYHPEVLHWRRLPVPVLAAAGAIALVLLYLWDPITAMTKTIYPGQRTDSGGAVSWVIYGSQFLPHMNMSGFRHLQGFNLNEIATVGSYLPLLLVIFVNHQRLSTDFAAALRTDPRLVWRVGLLLTGIGLISTWMLAPVPAGIGQVLLWDRVPPVRMIFALGILILLLALEGLSLATLVVDWRRLAIFFSLLTGSWLYSIYVLDEHRHVELESFDDFLILIPLITVIVVGRRLRIPASVSLVAAAALSNLMAFGPYNPIQSARPLFDRPQTAVTQALRQIQAAHPKNWLAVPGFPGAILNGYGYRSVSHVAITPQLNFFQALFPNLPEEKFNFLFNRYAHIKIAAIDAPISPQRDVVKIPLAQVAPPLPTPLVTIVGQAAMVEEGGFMHVTENSGARLKLSGWGLFDSLDPDRKIILVSPATITKATVLTQIRPDVANALSDPRLLFAGFELVIDFANKTAIAPVCVITEDPTFGRHLVRNTDVPCRLTQP